LSYAPKKTNKISNTNCTRCTSYTHFDYLYFNYFTTLDGDDDDDDDDVDDEFGHGNNDYTLRCKTIGLILRTGGNQSTPASHNCELVSPSSSAIYADMTLGDECGDAEPSNIVSEETMRTGFVSRSAQLQGGAKNGATISLQIF